MRVRSCDVGDHARQRLGPIDEQLDLRARPRLERAVLDPAAGTGVERPVPPASEAPPMVRPDRLLDQLAEWAVDTFDDARRHAGYWPLPLVVVGGGAGGEAVVVGGAGGGGAGVDVVGCGCGCGGVVAVVVDDDDEEYVGT